MKHSRIITLAALLFLGSCLFSSPPVRAEDVGKNEQTVKATIQPILTYDYVILEAGYTPTELAQIRTKVETGTLNQAVCLKPQTTSTAVGRTICRRLLNGVISLACYKFISDSITGLHIDPGLC